MPEIAVIGGGIAGCTTALELAKEGHKVVIYEKDTDILQGTSARTPGRMGLGHDYFHPETAEHYMRQTIEFMKQYPDCFVGDKTKPYLQHGRYFIMKNSLVSHQTLMANYDKISLKFEQMCREDQGNDIFGTTHLHRALEENEFKSDVSSDKIEYAIETQEHLLDWQKFSAKLKSEIESNPNIEIRRRSAPDNIEIDENGQFVVSHQETSEKFDYVVNCTWQNIESLNAKLGIGDAHFTKDDPKKSSTSRLKLLAEVELPNELKTKNSMFFCVGPYAMFSNLGDGIGRITFAPITNFCATTKAGMPKKLAQMIQDEELLKQLRQERGIAESVDLSIEEKEELVMDHFNKLVNRWLDKGLSEEEKEKYGQQIIDGVAEYIPAMKDAKLLRVIPGIVKSKGSVEIDDKSSPFHKRDYSGVEEQQIGWIDNAAMKLFYCWGNAEEVAKIIEEQELAKIEMQKVVKEVIDVASLNQTTNMNQEVLGQFFTNHLQRNFKSADFDEKKIDKVKKYLVNSVEKKGIVIKEITRLVPEIKEKNGIEV